MTPLLLLSLALSSVAKADPCPAGHHELSPGVCVRDATEIDFIELDVHAQGTGPEMALVMERGSVDFPCEELRLPGILDAWETCLVNYYGTAEIAALSYSIASRFVESGACPNDSADIETLRLITEHYAKNPKEEDLSDLQVPPLDPTSSAVEPHLPALCGYSVAQRKWYAPRSLYCSGVDCFPQAATGPKNRVRYAPLRAPPNLMKVVSDDPEVKSVGDGGSYGYLRIIPLGSDVYLATAGGMYGNIFFYGLVIVPHEEQYLHRACDRETAAKSRSTRAGKRKRLLSEASTLVGQAQALVELQQLAAELADPANLIDDGERAEQRSLARGLEDVLRGRRPAPPVGEAGCVRYQARYPRQYERVQATLGSAAPSR